MALARTGPYLMNIRRNGDGQRNDSGATLGARAQDWATYVEQVCLPLFGAALDAARVTSGARLLDAGCGAGLLALLASLRGAEVAALDASPGLFGHRAAAFARGRRAGGIGNRGQVLESGSGLALTHTPIDQRMVRAMVRPLRIGYPGALYHVTARGDGGEAIYRNDADREDFLRGLASVIGRYHWRCHAYCLMDNHYHLLLETPEANLSKGMRQLNGLYTQRFNRRHRRVGHVLQGRFKAILVEKDAYLLELARYIVLNPVRAKIVRKPHAYRWSSYRDGWTRAGACVPCHRLGAQSVRCPKGGAQRRYGAFVAAGIGAPSIWAELKQQIYLGSDRFIKRALARLDTSADLSEVPRAQRRAPAKELSAQEKRYSDRHAAMAAAYRSGRYSLAAIARHFGLHYSTVSRAVSRWEEKKR
jgi:putative transposase